MRRAGASVARDVYFNTRSATHREARARRVTRVEFRLCRKQGAGDRSQFWRIETPMPRVKRGVIHSKRRRNILADAKGYRWGRKSRITLAQVAVTKAGVHAYVDRKRKKREFRALWLIRLNAALRTRGTTYSRFIHALKTKNVALDRKILATLALEQPAIFDTIVTQVMK